MRGREADLPSVSDSISAPGEGPWSRHLTRLAKGGHVVALTDWNRTAIQKLILDAEDALRLLDDALASDDYEEQARAIRNGRRAHKELMWRRRNFLLTPLAAKALEQLFAQIQGRIFTLREKLMATRRWA